MAKAAPAGLRAGVEIGAGAGGDVRGLQDLAIQWILDKTGGTKEQRDRLREITANHTMWSRLPSTEGIRNRLTNPVLGKGYDPKTPPGKYVFTGFEFAAAGLAPGGPARKAVTSVVPAFISETAGQLTEGTAWEPWARFFGALAGGGIASAVPGRALEKTALIRGMQRRGHSPDEIKRALASFDEAGPLQEARAPLPTAPKDWDHLIDIIDADPDLGKLLDEHILKYYDDELMPWSGPFGRNNWPTVTGPYGKLKGQPYEGEDDLHHILQDASVGNLVGYYEAPAMRIGGRANVKGSPHYLATQVQREPGGGTLGAELGIGLKGVKAPGTLTKKERAQIAWEVMQFLKYRKLTSDTPTRIPLNRRKQN